MKTTILRGVPLAMRQDGWWLDAPAAPPQDKHVKQRRDSAKVAVLLG